MSPTLSLLSYLLHYGCREQITWLRFRSHIFCHLCAPSAQLCGTVTPNIDNFYSCGGLYLFEGVMSGGPAFVSYPLTRFARSAWLQIRLEAMDNVVGQISVPGVAAANVTALIQGMAHVPGWNDKNFQVQFTFRVSSFYNGCISGSDPLLPL